MMTTSKPMQIREPDALIEHITSGSLSTEAAIQIAAAWSPAKKREIRQMLTDMISGNFIPNATALLRAISTEMGGKTNRRP